MDAKLEEVIAALEKQEEPPRRGDRILKEDGDYSFEGEVLRLIRKRSGAKRYLVESDKGVLLVMSDKQKLKVTSRCIRPEEDRMEDYEEALYTLKQWGEAYPLDVFPEPDLGKAAEILEKNGMTIDAISASCLRHVLGRIKTICEKALNPPSGS